MSERQVECEMCGGDGGFDDCVGHEPLYGPVYHHFICSSCNGDGWYAVDDEPITQEDICWRA